MEFIGPSTRWFNDLSLTPVDRLSISRRLQELAIGCEAKQAKRLRVCIRNCCDAIQVWSVVQQVTAPRCALLTHLEKCWQSIDESHRD
ncbi:MAG: Asr1405/Asl0597 family protein [Geitlerinemataceae cyanobacterium]